MDKASKAAMRPTGLAMRTTSGELIPSSKHDGATLKLATPKPRTARLTGPSSGVNELKRKTETA